MVKSSSDPILLRLRKPRSGHSSEGGSLSISSRSSVPVTDETVDITSPMSPEGAL